jgi:hypothetical protein
MAHFLVAMSLLVDGCTSATFPPSEHFDGHRFHNRQAVPDLTFWEEVRIAWILRTKAKNWPARFESKPADVSSESVLHGIRVVWVGDAGALIQTPSLNIITDPVPPIRCR